jgi:hypothetical protein
MSNFKRHRIGLTLIFLSALLSLLWDQGEAKAPPCWALVLSGMCVSAGLVLYAYALKDWLALVSPRLSTPDGNTSAALGQMRKSVSELDTRLTEHTASVRQATPADRENIIESIVRQLEEEFPRLLRKYFCIRHYDFRRLVVEMAFVVIVFFASMYMATLTLESGLHGSDDLGMHGYVHSGMGKRNIPAIVLESLYFSTVTFVSLGYGDISPSQSAIARMLAIMEALSFLFLLGIGLSFALTTLNATSALETPEAMRQIRQELWAEAGPEERTSSLRE